MSRCQALWISSAALGTFPLKLKLVKHQRQRLRDIAGCLIKVEQFVAILFLAGMPLNTESLALRLSIRKVLTLLLQVLEEDVVTQDSSKAFVTTFASFLHLKVAHGDQSPSCPKVTFLPTVFYRSRQ